MKISGTIYLCMTKGIGKINVKRNFTAIKCFVSLINFNLNIV